MKRKFALRKMKRIFAILSVILLAVTMSATPPRRSSSQVRRQRTQHEQQMRLTDEQIKQKRREISNALIDLNRLNVEVQTCTGEIDRLRNRIDSIGVEIKTVNDSIDSLNEHLERLRTTFARVLRQSRRSSASLGSLAFIFSSDSFTQAFRRLRALKQFSKWRARKAEEITSVMTTLEERHRYLDTLEMRSREAISDLNVRKAELLAKQQQTNTIVGNLRGEEKQLKHVLADQQRKAADLDKELQRVIEQEQREAEERARREAEERARREAEERARQEAQERARREAEAAAQQTKNKDKGKDKGKNKSATTPAPQPAPAPATPAPAPMPATAPSIVGGDFAANKGRLSYPVEKPRQIVKRFGRQRHPSLPYVETDNSGIDIQTSSGAAVRCIYEGEVSAIFCPDGYNNVVVVRHGNYVTVYANLGSLNVRKGDKVARNQQIGTVYVDTADNNRSVLHFEIRNATVPSNIVKENPEDWLK